VHRFSAHGIDDAANAGVHRHALQTASLAVGAVLVDVSFAIIARRGLTLGVVILVLVLLATEGLPW